MDMADNTKPRQIYVVPVAGGEPRLITNAGTANSVRDGCPIPSACVPVSIGAGRSRYG